VGARHDVLDLELIEVAVLLREGQLSPVEVTRAALERIDAVDSRLRTFITVTAEAALAAARDAEDEIRRGGYRGPLHGVPVALKDVIATRGVRTTNGSTIFAASVPEEDAAVTARLREAGAIIVGKNNMHEFAMGSTTANPYFGVCRNPWNPEHVPGAARVAARGRRWPPGSASARSDRTPSTGCPALSVPCGFVSTGVPVGLQFAARAFEETTILRVARAYEQATEWSRRRPPLLTF
jgi:aspartyl-tRNA(Asn)/glutamyl-tRNA(Gln) amidotransferase subunit A